MTQFAAIEIKSELLRVVVAQQQRAGGPIKITAALAVPLEGATDPAQRGAALAAALKQASIQPSAAGLVVPRSQANVRNALLPSGDAAELASMARFEADRHLPLNAERHIVEHALLGKPAVEGTSVLIAAVDEPVALENLDAAVVAGFDVSTIGVSSLALYRSYVRTFYKEGAPPEGPPALLIHLDEDGADLVLAANGLPAYNRSAPVGVLRLIRDIAAAGGGDFSSADLTRLDALEPHRTFVAADSPDDPAAAAAQPQGAIVRAWLLRLLREIRQTVDFARRESGAATPETIYLSGPGAAIGKIAEFLSNNTGAQVLPYNPSTPYEVESTVNWPGGVSAYTTCLGGLDLPPSSVPYPNLIPSKYISARREREQKRNLIVVGAQVVLILLLGYLLVAQRMNHMVESTDALSELNQKLSAAASELQAKQTRNQIVRNFIRGNSSPVAILDQISQFKIVPEKVTLTRFEYKKDEYVKVSGHALDIAAVNAMESELRQTGLFDRVSQDQGSNAPVQLPNRGKDGTVLQYSITCEFPKPSTRSSRRTEATATAVEAQ